MPSVKIGAGEAVLFVGLMKLPLSLYRKTSRHFESKESPGKVCLLCHGIRHLQSFIKNVIPQIFKI